MKVLSVSGAKARLGRVIDQVIKTREPVVIPRGANHVMIAPYHLPTPDEVELAAVFRETDKGRPSMHEDAELIGAVQEEVREVRKSRPSKRRRK